MTVRPKPSETSQLAPLARYCAAHPAGCNVVGVHVLSFGGVTAAAGWMNRVIGAREAA